MKTCNKEKYKIAYIMHRGDTMGGFPQHTEMSIKGFKELGHEVDFFFLDYSNDSKEKFFKKKQALAEKGLFKMEGKSVSMTKGEGTGFYYQPKEGWFCPVTPYKTMEAKKELKEKLETYDVVFWHTPFWFKTKATLKDTDWPMLLDLKNPVNIAFVHDANIRDNGAWQLKIDKYFDRIINVHHASYNSCSVMKTPRTLIFNPQDLSKMDRNRTGYSNKGVTNLLFSLQNWKASKHVDDLIRAVPYISEELNIWTAGHGLEASYMFSKDKVKDNYFCSIEKDPDVDTESIGKTIVSRAMEHPGYEKLFWLSAEETRELMNNSLFFIDTAWYKINRELGSHFSRTLVESMMSGVVPIARNLGLSDNDNGFGEVFNPEENYLMIPWNATPKQFGELINSFYEMSESEYNEIVQRNYDLVEELFDYKKVIAQYIDVIRGIPTGYFGEYETGGENINPKILQKSEKQWFGTGDKRTFNFKK